MQYPRVIYSKVMTLSNTAMDKYEERRRALADLVKSMGRGAINTIAAKIEKDPSYVSRMLYPPNKKGHKRIGEDTLDLLVAAFPGAFSGRLTPPHASNPQPRQIFTKERRASDDVVALQLGMQALVTTVLNRLPGTAEPFLDLLNSASEELSFSTKTGLLASLVGIADEARHAEEVVNQALQRARSGGKPKPKK